jgi:hypothetical protein
VCGLGREDEEPQPCSRHGDIQESVRLVERGGLGVDDDDDRPLQPLEGVARRISKIAGLRLRPVADGPATEGWRVGYQGRLAPTRPKNNHVGRFVPGLPQQSDDPLQVAKSVHLSVIILDADLLSFGLPVADLLFAEAAENSRLQRNTPRVPTVQAKVKDGKSAEDGLQRRH